MSLTISLNHNTTCNLEKTRVTGQISQNGTARSTSLCGNHDGDASTGALASNMKVDQHVAPCLSNEAWQVNPLTGQFEDRENLQQLKLLVQHNPILRHIQAVGARTPKRSAFPNDASSDYFYEYLRGFLKGTWALPQVFCRVIKGLNSNHWLSMTALRFRERRHLSHDDGKDDSSINETKASKTLYGLLRTPEVDRLRASNEAFFQHYVQMPPEKEQLEKLKQRLNARKLGAGIKRKVSVEESNVQEEKKVRRFSHESMASDVCSQDMMKPRGPLKKRKPKLGCDSNVARKHSATQPPSPPKLRSPSLPLDEVAVKGEWRTSAQGQFVDRTDTVQLQAIIEMNPVLGFIQERGGKTPKKVLFPDDSNCEYFYEYLQGFPPGTRALPQVFCREMKGLNSNHWLSMAAVRLRDRRHNGEGKGQPYGNLRTEEVERLKASNEVFYWNYINVPPSPPTATSSCTTKTTTGKENETSFSKTYADCTKLVNAGEISENKTQEYCKPNLVPLAKDTPGDSGRAPISTREIDEDDNEVTNLPTKTAAYTTREDRSETKTSTAYKMFPQNKSLVSDPVLQRQILEEHLLRTGLLRQQAPNVVIPQLLQMSGTSALWTQQDRRASFPSSYEQHEMNFLSLRNDLEHLLAHLNSIPGESNFSKNQIPSETFDLILGSANGSTNGSTVVSHLPYTKGRKIRSVPSRSTSLNMFSGQQNQTKDAAAVYNDASQLPTTDNNDDIEDDATDAEATSAEYHHDEPAMKAFPATKCAREVTMLDILAATASAARSEFSA